MNFDCRENVASWLHPGLTIQYKKNYWVSNFYVSDNQIHISNELHIQIELYEDDQIGYNGSQYLEMNENLIHTLPGHYRALQ